MFERIINLPQHPTESFFLWGPRKTGKSFLVKKLYPRHLRINLLDTDEFAKFSTRPSHLREECTAWALKHKNNTDPKPFFIIDEIQKVPPLLDEVHLMIEEYGFVFGLCGSSVRKLKRGRANLLGGRAVRYELRGLTYPELGTSFDLKKLLNRGYLPSHYLSANYQKLCQSYVNEYLKEEIAEEGLIRNLPLFSDFLRGASFSDGEMLNYTNIAADCGVSSQTVKEYFQILNDTLIGEYLPAYTKRPKRKVIHAPKFYFFDVALTNVLTRRKEIVEGSELWGKVFENWVHHELKSYILYKEKNDDLAYWRLADSGYEVDFVVNDFWVAVEAKGSERIRPNDLKGLRELKQDHPTVGKRIIVCLENKRRKTEDGILIVPFQDFAMSLWDGEWI